MTPHGKQQQQQKQQQDQHLPPPPPPPAPAPAAAAAAAAAAAGSANSRVPVECADSLSYADFVSRYMAPNKPVLIQVCVFVFRGGRGAAAAAAAAAAAVATCPVNSGVLVKVLIACAMLTVSPNTWHQTIPCSFGFVGGGGGKCGLLRGGAGVGGGLRGGK